MALYKSDMSEMKVLNNRFFSYTVPENYISTTMAFSSIQYNNQCLYRECLIHIPFFFFAVISADIYWQHSCSDRRLLCYDTCIIKYDLEMFTLAAAIYNLAWLLSCRFHFRRSGPEQRMPDL